MSDTAVALFDYEARSERELSIKKGDVIAVSKRDPSGWGEGVVNGKSGWFPLNFVGHPDSLAEEKKKKKSKSDKKSQRAEKKAEKKARKSTKLSKSSKVEAAAVSKPAVTPGERRETLDAKTSSASAPAVCMQQVDDDANFSILDRKSQTKANLSKWLPQRQTRATMKQKGIMQGDVDTDDESTISTLGPDQKKKASKSGGGRKRKASSTAGSPATIYKVDLDVVVSHGGCIIPPIVTQPVEFLRENALESKGLFRISGIASDVNRLGELFLQDDVLHDLSKEDINAVSGCLKKFFRELPRPLFTFQCHEEFIAATNEAKDKKPAAYLAALKKLPDMEKCIVKYLLTFLAEVAAKNEVNMMTPSNLGIVFGPTLMRSKAEDASGFINPMSPASAVIQDLTEMWEDTIAKLPCDKLPSEFSHGGPRPKTAEELAAEAEKERMKEEKRLKKEAMLKAMLAGPGDSSRSPTTSNTQTADPRSKQSAAMARQISAKNMKATSDTDLCAPSKADKAKFRQTMPAALDSEFAEMLHNLSDGNTGTAEIGRGIATSGGFTDAQAQRVRATTQSQRRPSASQQRGGGRGRGVSRVASVPSAIQPLNVGGVQPPPKLAGVTPPPPASRSGGSGATVALKSVSGGSAPPAAVVSDVDIPDEEKSKRAKKKKLTAEETRQLQIEQQKAAIRKQREEQRRRAAQMQQRMQSQRRATPPHGQQPRQPSAEAVYGGSYEQAGYAQPAYSSPHANQSGNSPGMNQAGYVITGSPVVNQAGYVTPASPAINQAGYVVPGAPVNQAGYVVPDASPVATSAAASPTSDPTKLSTAALRAKQRAEAIRRQQQEMEKMEKKLTKDPTVQVQKRVSAYKQATVRPQPSTSDRTSNEQYQAVAAQPGPPAGEPFVAMFPFAGDKNFGQIDMAQGEQVTVIDRDPSGWWTAMRADGSQGKVPMNYIQPAPSQPSPQSSPATSRHVSQEPAQVQGGLEEF